MLLPDFSIKNWVKIHIRTGGKFTREIDSGIIPINNTSCCLGNLQAYVYL